MLCILQYHKVMMMFRTQICCGVTVYTQSAVCVVQSLDRYLVVCGVVRSAVKRATFPNQMLTPAKLLKAVDTSQPAHFLKGGVLVDPRLFDWLPPHYHEGLRKPPLLMTVDLSKKSLSDIISLAAVGFEVDDVFPADEGDSSSSSSSLCTQFGLLDTNDTYVTALSRLNNGFTLRFTLSPARLVNQLWTERLDTATKQPTSPTSPTTAAGDAVAAAAAAAATAAAPNSTAALFDSALARLSPYACQRVVLAALDEAALTDEILEVYERPDLERTTTELLLGVTCGLVSAGLDWARLPARVFELVEGLIKSSSSSADTTASLVHAVRLLTLAIQAEDPSMRARAVGLVSLSTLCPLVSRAPAAEKLTTALLSLFRATYHVSEGARRTELAEYFGEPAFKAVLLAASVHVERESTALAHPSTSSSSSASLLHALQIQSPLKTCLLDLLQIRLADYAAAAAEQTCSTDTIKKMLELREVEEDDDLRVEWVATLREAPRATLTARFLLYMHRHAGELLENWRKEKRLRELCGARSDKQLQLLPLAMHMTEVFVGLLALEGQENREWLWLALPVLLEDTQQTASGALVGHPVERCFVTAMLRAHAVWSEMDAVRGEEQLVAAVLTEMLWIVVRHRGVKTVAELAEGLRSLSYEKLSEERDEEMRKRADADEMGGLVAELRRRLEPLALSYVTTNRINAIKLGHTFKKVVKGKVAKESTGELWKLEGNGNFLAIRDIDSGGSVSQRIEVKEITGAVIEQPSKSNPLHRLKLSVAGQPDLFVYTEERAVLLSWVDGLNSLNAATHSLLSRDARALVQRVLMMEVRVRLLNLPPGAVQCPEDVERRLNCPAPPPPTSFQWCADALKKAHVVH